MYKEINGKIDKHTVRPVEYQDHLAEGWTVDKPKIKPVEEVIVEPEKVDFKVNCDPIVGDIVVEPSPILKIKKTAPIKKKKTIKG